MGALCFVTLFGVVGAKPLPLGEPRVLKRSVKTHKGLLLTRVTEPYILKVKQFNLKVVYHRGQSINATRQRQSNA